MEFIFLVGIFSMYLQLKIFVFGLFVNIIQNKQYEKYLMYVYGEKKESPFGAVCNILTLVSAQFFKIIMNLLKWG